MKIKLEKFTVQDIPKLVSWIPDNEFLLQWAGPSYSLSSLGEQLQNDINAMSNNNGNNLMLSAKSLDNNEIIGHIQLMWIDKVNMSARLGRVLIGNNEYRNKGLGYEMVCATLNIAFNQLKLHRVDLGVFDFNKSAISCYRKAGFITEGILRECRKNNGQYWSLVNMSILEDEYRNLK